MITLGSPFANEPKASNAWRLYEALSGRSADDWPEREAMKLPPPVPSTAIYTRSDGIVAWQGCLEQEIPTTQNIEVEGSHSGLGHNPVVLYAIADRLALPEDEWRPFDRSGLRRLLILIRSAADGCGAASRRCSDNVALLFHCRTKGGNPWRHSRQTSGSDGASSRLFDDIKKLTEKFQLPSVDIDALIDWQRRDLETLTEANRQASEGLKALVERRNEILHETLSQCQAAIKDATSGERTRSGRKPANRAFKR